MEFDQRRRQGAAIDGDEGFAAPIGRPLDGARHQFLADAGFALDQHGDIGFCRALAQPQRPAHGFALRNNVAEGDLAGSLASAAADFAFQRGEAQGVLDRNLHPFGGDRLDHEIQRAGAHGRDHRFNRAMRCLHDDRRVDLALAHALQHAHAVEIGHDEIEDQQIDAGLVGGLQARQSRLAAVDRLGLIAKSPHHDFQQAALNGIIVGDQNGRDHQESFAARRRRRRFAPICAIRVNAVLMARFRGLARWSKSHG